MTDLKATLLSKKWYGFDLDDTLHEFRKASSQASQSVFEAIHNREKIDIDVLKSTYGEILRKSTASAFTDGRASTEYRRERFTSLLKAHQVEDSNYSKVDVLLDVYKSSLQSNLTLKSGVLNLFEALKRLGKNIIVITEGPTDAQEWTIHELGLEPFVDVLITTNEIGRSKVDGLFGAVLDKYEINAEEIVYFGDNPVRDTQAAKQSGILAILYDEKKASNLDDLNALSINSWEELQKLLSGN